MPRASDKPLKVCMVTALPPPYGGIGHWATLICNHAKNNDVIIRVVDVAPRWRNIDDLRVWKRVVFGGLMMVWHVFQVIWHLLCGCRAVHIATPGQLSVFRDMAIVLVAKMFRVGTLYHLHFGRIPAIAGMNTREWERIRRVMRLVDVVVPLDIATEKTIRSHLPMVRTARIPNCLDLSRSPVVPPASDTGVRTVMYLGWVVPSKGINELVIAWSELKLPNWRLQIVGPGDPKYQQQLLNQYHPTNLEFLGERSHEEAMGLLAKADVLVLPSYTEGFPNVVMEAMSLGKAVIATSVGALPEMLDNGCGVLFPPQQVDRLKEALATITENAHLRRQIGMLSQSKATSEYSLPKVFGQLKSLWEELAGTGQSDNLLKVCMVAPLPPPYGGIGHWTSMIYGYAKGKDLRLRVVDVAPRWRSIEDLRMWKRVVFGGLTMIWHITQVVWHLLHGYRIVHIATPGQLSLFRDLAVVVVARLFRARSFYHIRFGRVPEIAENNTREWRRMTLVMKWAYQVIAIDRKTFLAVKKHLPKTNVIQLPNCVDISRLPPSKPSNGADSRTVVYLAWVIPTKGIEELAQAWHELKPVGWKLKVIGPGDREYQKRLIDRHHLDDSVEFAGEMSHDDAMNSLAGASIFILPSHTEGFPNVIAEAMALGKPIIATSVGAIPEMLDGGCGRLIPSKDSGAIKQALAELMNDKPHRDAMGCKSFAKVRSEYTLPVIFSRLISIWQSA